MTKSRPKFFGTTLMTGLNLFSLTLFLGKTWEMVFKTTTTLNDWGFLLFMLSFFSFTLHVLLTDTRVITIDKDRITYKNWLTGHIKQYSFKDLDGFTTQSQSGHSGDYEVIFLKRGNKRFGQISSFYYSNYNELTDGLRTLRYLGREPFDIIKSIKSRLTE